VEDFHRWDETDTLPGFVLHTGQVGKPYRQLRHGVADRYWHSPLARDPLDGHTNVYFLDPQTQLRHYDTRTPYVDASFAQNSKDMQLLDVQISQNATPRWNFTAHYHRRTAVGAYLNNRTDNLNAALGSLWRSRRGRVWNRTAVAFNQMTEQLNGGMRIGTGVDYLAGVFRKRTQPVVFAQPGLWGRVQRTAYTEGGFFAVNDSAFQLGAVAGARYDFYTRSWLDKRTVITPTGLASDPYPALQPGDTLRGTLAQYAYVAQSQAWAGGVLNVQLGRSLGWQNRVHYTLDSRRALNNSPLAATAWNRRTLAAESHLQVALGPTQLSAHLHLHQTSSNLASPEFALDGAASLGFGSRDFLLLDSTVIDTANRFARRSVRQPLPYAGRWTPLALDYALRLASLNPGWVQLHWQGPTFLGNAQLANEGLYYTEAGARFTGRPGISQGLPLLPNTARVGVGVARLSRPIYYGPQMWVLQAPEGQGVSYPFASLQVRWRVWRLYAENHTEATLPTRGPEAPPYLAAQVPRLQGTARVFVRQMLFRRNLQLYLALECRYHSGFQALKLDPVTAELYPLPGYTATPYARVDAVVAAKIRSAQVFVKVIHLNERLWQPGYYTLLFYPMLERGFSFGVRWQLWD
jgi:hypothetical protein